MNATPRFPPTDEDAGPTKLDCLGVGVVQTGWAELSAWVYRAAVHRERPGARTLYFANAHALNSAWTDVEVRAAFNRADVVVNDGIGIELYGRIARSPFGENLNGSDLVPRLFASVPEGRRLRVYLFGAEPGRALAAKAHIEARYPRVEVVGVRDGFDHADVVSDINASRADLLLVGMGNPLQEKWIDAHRGALEVGLAMGVGALLDFLSGEVRRAPRLVQRMRVEWLFRLAREPRRMFGRYVLGNPAFLLRSIVYLFAATASRRPSP